MTENLVAGEGYTTEWPGVNVKDMTVNVSDIDPILKTFLSVAGKAHIVMFDKPLIVTSGRDGYHVASSKHGEGKAVDLRIGNLLVLDQCAWLATLRVWAARFGLAVFDESFAPGMGHVHIEIAG